jgi:hypothetical protein
MRRRTNVDVTASALLEEVRHGAVQPPWKRVRLERRSFEDYRHRSTSATTSIAEVYHENSKLFPAILPELAAMNTNAHEFRLRVVHDRAAEESPGLREPELDASWAALFRSVRDAIAVELFYAVELRVAADGLLAILEPVSGRLDVIKRLSASDRQALNAALSLLNEGDSRATGDPVLFVLGRFAWNEVLLGPRGYRRTLLEAGRLGQEIVRQAEALDLYVRPVSEFTDRDVDDVMEADGVEEGTLIVFATGGAGDVG